VEVVVVMNFYIANVWSVFIENFNVTVNNCWYFAM